WVRPAHPFGVHHRRRAIGEALPAIAGPDHQRRGANLSRPLDPRAEAVLEHVQSSGQRLPIPLSRDARPASDRLSRAPPEAAAEIAGDPEPGGGVAAADGAAHPRHRLLLTTVYAAGLRVSEAIALKVADIDADRMTIRITQG